MAVDGTAGLDAKVSRADAKERGNLSKDEEIEIKAEAEERRHYEILNADLNDIRPLITSIERKEQQEFSNKHRHEKIAQKQRETYQKNKEEINRKRREKYKEKTLLQTVVVLD